MTSTTRATHRRYLLAMLAAAITAVTAVVALSLLVDPFDIYRTRPPSMRHTKLPTITVELYFSSSSIVSF